MKFKITPKPGSSARVKADCGGWQTGIRNMMLGALTEAKDTDFKNSGDRVAFGSAEKAMWGLRDWRDATPEELLQEITEAAWAAMFGRFGAHEQPPTPVYVVFGTRDESDNPLREELDKLKQAIKTLMEAWER